MKNKAIILAVLLGAAILFSLLLILTAAYKYLPKAKEAGGETQAFAPLQSDETAESALPEGKLSSPPSIQPPSMAPTPEPTPAKAVLLDVPALNQVELGYPLGCEIVSLTMMISYTKQVELADIYTGLPRGENPNEGFRGDPASTSYGWTIFPKALIPLTEQYLDTALDMSACETEDLKDKLREQKPVMVWVVGLGWPVHCICLSGFDENGFYYNDPANGAKDVFISNDDFYEIWTKQIYDRKLGLEFPSKIAMSY